MVTQRQPRQGGSAPVFRGIRLLLAFVLFMGEGSWAYAARDLWSDRRRAVRSARSNPTPDLRHSSWDRLVAAFPTIEKRAPLPLAGPASRSSLPHWLESAVGFYADVGESHLPTKGERRVLIHIQDLHDVEEAQRNIAAVLDQLAGSLGGTRGLLVGLEGAAGGFRTADYRALASAPILRRVSERFLKAGIISGPEFFSLTTPQSFRLWGVEDAPAYVANIRALTDTFPQQAKDDRIVARAFSPVEKLKDQFYPAALKELDRVRTQYDNGEVGLVAYVQKLSQGAPSELMGPTLRLFLEAVAQERDLSLKEVANDQSRLLETLAPLLNDAELKQLVDTGLAQRMGRVSFSRFYGLLRQICKNHNVSMERYPSLVAHAAYGVKSEGIDPSLLLRDVDQLAHRAIQSHLTTPLLVELSSLNEDVRLVEKLNRFVLVPEDFRRLVHRRAEIKRWNKRGAGLGGGIPSSAWPDLGPVMERHEKFYLQAERRNRPLVQNLIAQWNDSSPAVLVAGGYHTEGVRAAALSEGLGYISLVPRVSSVDHFPPPLESFRTKGKQSEWVFRGEVSGLQRILPTAVSEFRNSTEPPMHSSQEYFQAQFIALAAAELARDLTPFGPLFASRLTLALKKMSDAARNIGIDLTFRIEKMEKDEIGRMKVNLGYSYVDRNHRSNAQTIRGSTSVNLETGEVRVQIGKEGGVGLIIDRLKSSLILGPRLVWGTITVAFARMAYTLGNAARNAAAILVSPLQSGYFKSTRLASYVDQWIQRFHLNEDRRIVAFALKSPPAIQSFLFNRLAESREAPMAKKWEPLVGKAIQSVRSGNPEFRDVEMTSVREGIAVRGVRDGTPFQIELVMSNSLALIEALSPYQMIQRSDDIFRVFVQSPSFDNESMAQIVISGALREIQYLLQGVNAAVAHQTAFSSQERLTVQLHFLASQYLNSMQALDGEILRAVEKAPQMPQFFTREQLDGIRLGVADDCLEATSGNVLAFQLFADYFKIRERLSRSFSVFGNEKEMLEPVVNLILNRLQVVGEARGRVSTVIPGKEDEQFLRLAQSLLGLLAVSGLQFDRIPSSELEVFVQNMLGLYKAHFENGARQALGESGEIADRSGRILLLDGPVDQSRQVSNFFNYLLGSTGASVQPIMVVANHRAGTPDEVRSALIDQLMLAFAHHPNVKAVSNALQSGELCQVMHDAPLRTEGELSLEKVFNMFLQRWPNHNSLGVFASAVEHLRQDVKNEELSWFIMDENGTIVSRRVNDARFRKAIAEFIRRQA